MEEEKKKENSEMYKEFLKDTLYGMDRSFEELKRLLYPVFHDKTKYVNGSLLKKCFKQIGYIIRAHMLLRREYIKQLGE